MTSIEDGIDTNKNKKEIEIGLDFILSHLEEPTIFPRTIMTKKLGYQRIVYSKEIALEHFIESDFIDCRINAFPSLKEGATWIPELLFIDLDLSGFNNKESLQVALNKTLRNIKEKLANENAHPTVLWSGNGYHIILPVYCPITSTVLSDSGDVVLAGGYNINSPDGSGIFILNTGASSTGDSYSTTLRADNVDLQTNALCFNNP